MTTAYDFWKQNDFEGERREAEAEREAERVADAWAAMSYRQRAEMISDANYSFAFLSRNLGHPPYGYSRKKYVRQFISERLA